MAVTLVFPPSTLSPADEIYQDCSDIPPDYPSGVYTLRLKPAEHRYIDVRAFCDMEEDGGGWTVIIRRDDIEPREDFYLDWEGYKWGFGHLKKEFYWGNEYIWMMTSQRKRQYQVRFWLKDWNGNTRYAVYENFTIDSEYDHYRLHIGDYSGDAGDSFYYNNNRSFTTYDRDYDDDFWDNCAEDREGAWWYWDCSRCQLTGKYYEGGSSESNGRGITWYDWRVETYSLKAAVMKIKPYDEA